MKLYTEEQVIEAIKSALDGFGIGDTQDTIDLIVSKYNPIELPSDGEIEAEASDFGKKYRATTYEKSAYVIGAKWMREQLKNKL